MRMASILGTTNSNMLTVAKTIMITMDRIISMPNRTKIRVSNNMTDKALTMLTEINNRIITTIESIDLGNNNIVNVLSFQKR